jgi:hypothetical protein
LENFKKLQGNLEFHQNKCHPRDVPDTRRFYVGLTRGFMHTCLHENWNAKAVEKISGGQTTCLAGHVARPADHHLASY